MTSFDSTNALKLVYLSLNKIKILFSGEGGGGGEIWALGGYPRALYPSPPYMYP